MAQVKANGIVLEYELSGPEDGEPLLMINGLGTQLIRWPQPFCDGLAAAGFRLIRYDLRDCGLSTHLDEVSPATSGGQTPYTLDDLADDAAALLHALEIEATHVLGLSFGGQVAQSLACAHPHRVRSMTVMMTRSGNPDLPPPKSAALVQLMQAAPDPLQDEVGYLDATVATARAFGSPAYPIADAELRATALAAVRRNYDPAGVARQLSAARSAPDNRADLARLDTPTLVIHGADDPLVPLERGQDIAHHVPRAWLLAIQGMGHDLPSELFDTFVSAIAMNARRSRSQRPLTG